MKNFADIFTLLAGLSLTIFGLKLLSTRLQEFASGILLRLLQGIREKDRNGIWRGTLFALLSCSTIAASGTVVSLVNAGLLRLRSGIYLIAGTNFGAPIFGLILALLPTEWAIYFLGLGFIPYLISARGQWRHIGGVLFGMGMILLGIHYLGLGMLIFKNNIYVRVVFEIMASTSLGYFIAFAIVGHLLTVLFRSSLVVFALLLAGLNHGVLSLNCALGAVVGLNLASAFLSMKMAKAGNIFGRRAAMAHRIFNWMGAILFILCYGLFLNKLNLNYPVHIQMAGANLFFNLVMLLVFLVNAHIVERLIYKFVPDEEINEEYELEVLGRPGDMIPSLALLQARYHILKLKDVLDRLFDITMDYVNEDQNDARTLAKVKDYERITDNMNTEITNFLGSLIENALSNRQALHVQMLVRIAMEMEDIADYLDKLATYNTRYNQNSTMTPENKVEFMKFFSEVRSFYHLVTDQLGDHKARSKREIDRQAGNLKVLAEAMRERHLERINAQSQEALALMTYSDMVVCLRKIRGRSLKIFNAFHHMTNS